MDMENERAQPCVFRGVIDVEEIDEPENAAPTQETQPTESPAAEAVDASQQQSLPTPKVLSDVECVDITQSDPETEETSLRESRTDLVTCTHLVSPALPLWLNRTLIELSQEGLTPFELQCLVEVLKNVSSPYFAH